MARTPRTRGGPPKAEPGIVEGTENTATPAEADAPAEFAASEFLTPEGEPASAPTGGSQPAGDTDMEAIAEPPALPDETAPPSASLTEFPVSDSLTPSRDAALSEPPPETAVPSNAPAEFAASESLLPEAGRQAPVPSGEDGPTSGTGVELPAEPPASPDRPAPPADDSTQSAALDSLTPGENAALAEPSVGDTPREGFSSAGDMAEVPPEPTGTAAESRPDDAASSSAILENGGSALSSPGSDGYAAGPIAETREPDSAAAPVIADPDEPVPAWQEAASFPTDDGQQADEAGRQRVAASLQDAPMAEMEGPGIAAAPVASGDAAALQSGAEPVAVQTPSDDARSEDWERNPAADSLNDVPSPGETPAVAVLQDRSPPDEAPFSAPAGVQAPSEEARVDIATPAALAASSAGGASGHTGDRDSAAPTLPPARRGNGSLFAAGLLGGVAALLLAGLLQFAGILPSTGSDAGTGADTQAFQSEIDGLRAELAQLRQAGTGAAAADPALGSRIDALQAEVEQLKSTAPSAGAVPPELETRLAAAEEKLAGLNNGVSADQLAAVSNEAAAARTAAQSNNGAIRDAAARVATLEQSYSGVRSSVATLEQSFSGVRSGVAGLQADVAQLQEGMETLQAQPRVALALAASALKEAAERGAPFTAELATLGTLAPDAPEIARLQPYAASGVPTRAALLADWNASVDAVLATENPQDENAGFLSRLLSGAGGLVSVRPIEAVEGPGTSAIVGRIQAAMDAGDLQKALAEFDTLPDTAKQAAAGFAERARARLAVEELVNGAIANAAKAA